MKLSKYFLPTTREISSEAVLASHRLMLRAGLIRKVGSGLYSYLPAGLRVLNKIKKIVKEEMDRAGALEVSMPLLIPDELLHTSNRWDSFKKELFTLDDHQENSYALSPTNEENFSDLAKKQLFSYRQFPINLYQINTKFRDEIRPRFGVMRSKEFIMKDGYSFHLSEECLDTTYKSMSEAYKKIFKRMDLDFASVMASSGAMGGNQSEEFMIKSDVGEETLLHCEKCNYNANVEKASEKIVFPDIIQPNGKDNASKTTTPVEKISTPDCNTIEKLADFLNIEKTQTIKTMVYQHVSIAQQKQLPDDVPQKRDLDPFSNLVGKMAVVLIRGDYDLETTKLENLLPDMEPASEKNIISLFGCPPGYLSPIGLEKYSKTLTVLVDKTLKDTKNMVAGANQIGFHLKNVNLQSIQNDFEKFRYGEIYAAKKGGKCPNCEHPLSSFKGIEVGHIFKLGKRYTNAFSHQVLDKDEKKVTPTMGLLWHRCHSMFCCDNRIPS